MMAVPPCSHQDLPFFNTVYTSLMSEGLDVIVYDETLVEPTDRSFKHAIQFAKDTNVDGFVSVGGGSVMDTAKAANLYSTYPTDDFLDYVNAPVGKGQQLGHGQVLKPHIACPTTAGTGSEVTGMAIFDLLEAHAKTGIAMRALRPSMAVIDPVTTETMPASVTACSGFDVLSHAIESYTALPHTRRMPPQQPHLRPLSQGSNPWADIGCIEGVWVLSLRALARTLSCSRPRSLVVSANPLASPLNNSLKGIIANRNSKSLRI